MTVLLKNNLTEIARLSEIVETLGNQHGMTEEVVYASNLALDEILTNVITYGYQDQSEHEIVVRFDISGNKLSMEVEDDGHPFNPLEAPTPNLEAALLEKEIGGLGIHFVKTLMDRVEYRREHEKNILSLTKSF